MKAQQLTLIVGCYETQYILVTQHYSLIDLRLTKPGAFLATREDFDGHVLATPTSAPHLAEASLANHMAQLHLACNGALHQQRQSSWEENSG